MGGRHTRVPRSPPGFYIPPLRSYHKPPYVKNLSFCVRASATSYYNLVIVEPAPSEIPLPRAARLFYWYRAGPMPQGVSYVHHANLYIRNLILGSMSIPSSASLALSGWGYTDFHASVNFAFFGDSANFAFWAFSEVRF